MKIAVVGAGYGGLSVSWHLLEHPNVKVTLIDAIGIGGGASGASTGLLHPYPAKKGNRSARADEAMRETALLIQAAETASGHSVASHSGIVRFAMNEEQKKAFQQPFPDAELLEEETIGRRFPDVMAKMGLWIPQGKTVFSGPYLKGLWLACEQKGALMEQRRIENLDELSLFDAAVLSNGADLARFELAADLPLNPRHGQALICRWPEGFEKPPCSLIGHGHLSLTEDPALCLLGSTYEKGFDPEKALALREQIGAFYPPARDFEIVGIRSGVRMAPKQGYLPLTVQIAPSLWVFTGLGSRGLLYHGLYGKELAEKIVLALQQKTVL